MTDSVSYLNIEGKKSEDRHAYDNSLKFKALEVIMANIFKNQRPYKMQSFQFTVFSENVKFPIFFCFQKMLEMCRQSKNLFHTLTIELNLHRIIR